MAFALEAVGHVRGGRTAAIDDDWGPNRLGSCVCRIVAVDELCLDVEGLDAIDGTPVLDIKPVLTGFLPRDEFREPVWAAEIMKDYW